MNPETVPSDIQELLTKGPQGIELTRQESELYRLLSEYREENGKPAIPLSKSLTYVAQLHVRDLTANKVAPPYTLQSWSKNGPWEGVRYTANHRHARLMWNKPKELTNYSGDGFEITFSRKGGTNARTAFNSWIRQKSVSSIILNAGNWETISWKAVGVGLHGEFAVIWFGDKEDQ
ncbi:MAG TPA: CAP domain-containing protein [Treponema sp.]|nr:CAP domain-containing protein [Treponema sp.]